MPSTKANDQTKPNLLDWSQVNSQISKFQHTLNLKKSSEAFVHFVLDSILHIDGGEIESAITDGPADRGIDAVYIEPRREKRLIHLFQMKHVGKFENAHRNFPSNECDKILSFVDDLLQKRSGLKESCNHLLWARVQDIWALMENEVFDFQINLCSNATRLTKDQRNRFEQQIQNLRTFRIEEYDLKRFSSIITGRSRDNVTLDIQLIGEQLFERTDGFVRGLIGTVGGDGFIEFLRDKDFPLNVDHGLFEENIRIYLGEKNEVNSKILNSALSENPAEFWYLNNGITIVCDSYQYQPKSQNPVVKISNPQVVNGGQTSFALFEAAQQDLSKVSNLRVLLRVIETKDRNFMNRIAEATNSQTPIRSRDLRSNDQIQLKLESALEGMGYFYERKRNQHLDKPALKRIDSLKAGQVILAYYLQEPDRAKTQSDRIFGELYELVFDANMISAERLLTAYRLYEAIETRKNLAVVRMRSTIAAEYSEQWLVEGIFHVLFMISVLCERDGIAQDEYDSAIVKLEEALQIVGSFTDRQRRASAYRIFRTASTKRSLKQISPAEQLELRLNHPTQ